MASALGLANARAGRIRDGLALLEQAVERILKSGRHALVSTFLVRLGEAYTLAGRLADAGGAAERALVVARERKERGHETWAMWLLGKIAAQADEADGLTAESRFCQALAFAKELGMRPLVAHCLLGLGELYRRTGRQRKAHEQLAAATTMYREMDMRFWLEQAEKEMGA